MTTHTTSTPEGAQVLTDTPAPGAGEAFTSREEYLAAVEQVREAAAAYYDSDTLVMDDTTYDTLVRRLTATEAASPQWKVGSSPTEVVGGGVAAAGDVEHTAPMLSLDNAFSEADLDAWAASLAKRLGRPVDGFTVEPKMDGLALAARYRGGKLVQLVTRGDGTHGEDVSFVAPHVVGLPATLTRPVDVEVRGEVLLTEAQFEAANELRLAHGDKPFSYARAGSAGALRGAKDRTYSIPLTFFGYGTVHLGTEFDGRRIDRMRHSEAMAIVAELGVQTTAQSAAGMAVCSTLEQVHAYIENLAQARPTLGFGVDGAVIKADSEDDRAEAGFSSKAPRWGIARKYPADTAISTLEEVIWQVGRTGVITPRARITPTLVGGTEITYATLHNVEDVARKGFMLGDKVVVLRAGEVIPRLEAPVLNLRDGSQTAIDIPQVCPRCGGEIDRSQARWRCARGRNCGLAELIRYAVARDSLDIEGLGERHVNQLVERALVADVADLFTLTREQLLTLERMGEKNADKILAQIEGAKTQPLSRVLTALGVRMTGRSLSRRIAKHFGTMDALLAADVAALEAVDGIGPERAAVIADELAELKATVEGLRAAGVNLTEPTAAAPAAADGGQDAAPAGELPFAGKTVCVSGTVPGLSRTQAQEAVEELGGKSTGSVSRKTTLLVAGDGAGSKLAKASDLGVEVMDAADFAALVAAHRG